MEVHLVDGTFELFRCFHGAPPATTSDGREVGAARALLATMVALLNDPAVTHAAVAFDAVVPPAAATRRPRPSDRGGAVAGEGRIDRGPDPAEPSAATDRDGRADDGDAVPGHRSEPPPPVRTGKRSEAALASQVGLAADVVRALGVDVWPSGRYQADELLATAAARFAADPRVTRVVICTTDLDLAQCVRGERVVLLDRTRKRVTTEADVVARFGVPPSLLADLFALVGDRSDGIAGVPGWGVRSAAALLAEYGAVDAIPDDPATWAVPVRGARRLADTLCERRRETIVARDVLRLRDDVVLHVDVEDLRWTGARRGALEALARTLEYRDPLEWLSTWAD